MTDTNSPYWKSIPENNRLITISIPAPELSVEQFLHYAQGEARFLWRSANDMQIFAGFGITSQISAWGADRFDTIQTSAESVFEKTYSKDAKFFGGFSFRDDFTPDNRWSIYNPADFFLPHYQFTQIAGNRWLSMNVQIPADEDQQILEELQEALELRYEDILQSDFEPTVTNNHLAEIRYLLDYTTWEIQINHATQKMRNGELEKAVLSRVCELEFEQDVDIDSALVFLNENYGDCNRFLIEPRSGFGFYGATPEILARVQGDQLETMAVAGSIQRGSDPSEDEFFAQQILNDPKERSEHDLVAVALRTRLENITENLEISDTPQVMQLQNIQHLYTPVTATLKDQQGIIDILSILHPTPALGGTPRDKAMQLIRETELVPRGWYGSPVGWFDAEMNGEFGVAIRSAVTEDRRVWMYAGCGVVADSVPEKEWRETDLKFRPMLGAHGVSQEEFHATRES